MKNFLFIKASNSELLDKIEQLGGVQKSGAGKMKEFVLLELKDEYIPVLAEYRPVEDFVISNRVTF